MAETVGTIAEIWRYPVSSIAGEALQSTDIWPCGVEGDRRWGLIDIATGTPAAPENDHRWRPALFLSARLRYGAPEIGFPDGGWMPAHATEATAKLTDHFGFAVEARPYGDAYDAHTSGRILNRYDPNPVHILTNASLAHLAGLVGEAMVDPRRFRPTILIETDCQPGFVESNWIGHGIDAGTLSMAATEETKRCGMTLIAQPGIAENADILRSIVRQNRRNLGIYCSVTRAGRVSVGDTIVLHDD